MVVVVASVVASVVTSVMVEVVAAAGITAVEWIGRVDEGGLGLTTSVVQGTG